MNGIIEQIRKDLSEKVDIRYKDGCVQYFTEKIDPLGVRTPEVRKISRQYWQKVKNLPKKEIIDLCKVLWSGKHEEFLIGCDWYNRINKTWDESDWQIMEWVVEKKISNWAHCDDFCNRCIGEYLINYPKYVREIYKWTNSKNRWVRRASIVSFIRPLRRKLFASDVYKISDLLICDKDDLVQKGFGWALRDAGKIDQKKLYDWLYIRRKQIPRISLRYAIEKMAKKDRDNLLYN